MGQKERIEVLETSLDLATAATIVGDKETSVSENRFPTLCNQPCFLPVPLLFVIIVQTSVAKKIQVVDSPRKVLWRCYQLS